MNNKQDYKRSTIEFLITFFFGFFGVHKFIKKKYTIGLIYLFTLGLFGFGWLVDSCISAYRVITLLCFVNKSQSNNLPGNTMTENINTCADNNNRVGNEVVSSNYKKRTYSSVICTKQKIDTDTIEKLRAKFIAIDTETTGLNPYYDRIVELGAAVFENEKSVKKYHSLVDPGIKITSEASRINHITNEMLQHANSEKCVYTQFVKFIEESITGDIIVCAHNADFDIRFLSMTFRRLGINANIKYVDTLEISKAYLSGMENYKQETLAKYFGIKNLVSHSAGNDAEVCGNILVSLLPVVVDKQRKEKIYNEKRKMTKVENIISGEFQQLIQNNFTDIEMLNFSKNTSGYIDMNYFYHVIRYKCASKGTYIIVPKNILKKLGLEMEECSIAEGKTYNSRVYFEKVADLDRLYPYIFKQYKKAIKDTRSYINHSRYRKEEVMRICNKGVVFSKNQEETL